MGVKKIDYEKCNDCEVCYDICPMDVFRKVGSTVFIASPNDCMVCYLCEIYCKQDAVYVSPERAKPIPLPY